MDTTAVLARRSLSVHDPSTLVRCGKFWYGFATGPGIPAFRSRDLIQWERGPSVFPLKGAETGFPAWWAQIIPGFDKNCWAPDIIRINNRYLLYYSVSSWGKNTSAIGLAFSPSLDWNDSKYGWTDAGMVVQTGPKNDYNAIDPSVCRDARTGALWLACGSFWGGIKGLRLDSKTGLQASPAAAPASLAWKPPSGEIEAGCLYQKGAWWYLFVNWGLCCRGIKSTYEIRIGRSKNADGPFLDQTGRDLQQGGGSLFLGGDTNGAFIGPGHAGIVLDGRKEYLSCHFYDGDKNGLPTLGILPLTWSKNGWPEILRPDVPPAKSG